MYDDFAPLFAPPFMKRRWSEVAIKRKKFDGKAMDFTIQGGHGLFFRVEERGTYYKWRKMHAGRNHRAHIGSVHEVGLSEALDTAQKFSKNVREGLPPRFSLNANSGLTFQQLYEAYTSSQEFNARSPNYREQFKLRMEKFAVEGSNLTAARQSKSNSRQELNRNKISAVSVDRIDQQIGRQLWSNIKGASGQETARLVKSHCKAIIDWAAQEMGVSMQINPFSFDVPRTPRARRERVFSYKELARLILAFQNEPQVKREFLNCCLLTGWRNGELRHMRWEELEWNVPIAAHSHNDPRTVTIWTAPPSSNKSKRAIRFVLTEAMSEQILSLPRQNEWVFTYGNTNAGGDGLPMTPPTKRVRQMMSELGFPGTPTLHTIRHTLVTALKEQGFAANAIDRFLGKNVKEGAASHGAYDHADSLAEKLTIAEAWESYLKSLGFGSN